MELSAVDDSPFPFPLNAEAYLVNQNSIVDCLGDVPRRSPIGNAAVIEIPPDVVLAAVVNGSGGRTVETLFHVCGFGVNENFSVLPNVSGRRHTAEELIPVDVVVVSKVLQFDLHVATVSCSFHAAAFRMLMRLPIQ